VKEKVEVFHDNVPVGRQHTRWQAIYRCFELREVTLSGCIHRALTVEAVFSGENGGYSQRWVCFPAPGLELETRRNDVLNGVVALGPA
jgi:hypothetical protein